MRDDGRESENIEDGHGSRERIRVLRSSIIYARTQSEPYPRQNIAADAENNEGTFLAMTNSTHCRSGCLHGDYVPPVWCPELSKPIRVPACQFAASIFTFNFRGADSVIFFQSPIRRDPVMAGFGLASLDVAVDGEPGAG